jgi:hypothetical protein
MTRSREAFAAKGNPLFSGGPVQFMGERVLGGGVPPLDPPTLVTPAVLTLSPDNNTLTYTEGVWEGFQPIAINPVLNISGGPSGVVVEPGDIPVEDVWRGRNANILERPTNAAGSGVQQVSNVVAIPPGAAPPFNTTRPSLALVSDELRYVPGVWAGNPVPTVVARLFIDGADTAAAAPVMPVQAAWRGKAAQVRETATNTAGGPVLEGTANVPIPAPPPPDLDAEVQAILAGRGGMAFDPRDLTTLFQDGAGTVPVTADGQPVGRMVRKFGDTAAYFFQNTAAGRPVLAAGELAFDGVDDNLNQFSNLSFFAGATGALVCFRILTTADPRTNVRITNATVNGQGVTERISTIIETSGRTANIVRKQDGGSPFNRVVNGDVLVGVPTTFSFRGDFSGANQIETLLNGVSVGVSPLTAPVGPMPNTPSQAMNFGGGAVACKLGRLIMLPFNPTPAELATLEAWVGEP